MEKNSPFLLLCPCCSDVVDPVAMDNDGLVVGFMCRSCAFFGEQEKFMVASSKIGHQALIMEVINE